MHSKFVVTSQFSLKPTTHGQVPMANICRWTVCGVRSRTVSILLTHRHLVC